MENGVEEQIGARKETGTRRVGHTDPERPRQRNRYKRTEVNRLSDAFSQRHTRRPESGPWTGTG